MSSSIAQVTLNSATETAILMANSSFARPISLPSGWQKVRVGVRLYAGWAGGALSSTPRLAVGLCAGTTNLIGDATTDHFAGVITSASGWSWSTNTGYTWFYNIAAAPCTRIGSTLSVGSNLNTNLGIGTVGGSTGVRSFWFADITKGSPNYTFNVYAMSGGSPPQAPADQSATAFLNAMALDVPSVTGMAFGSAQGLAVDEATHGTLNAASVWWNRADVGLYLCDLAVAILA